MENKSEDKFDNMGKVRKYIKDGWENLLKGFGGKKDATQSTTFGEFRVISDLELASIYAGDGWGSNIASVPAEDAISEWISLSDDGQKEIAGALDALKVQDAFKQALTWQRLFRGGLIWMVSDKDPKVEYRKGVKQRISKLKVFSASEVRVEKFYGENKIIPGETVTKLDPLKIGEVESFRIMKNSLRSEDIIVHSSQCLIFKGLPLPSVPNASFETLFQSSDVEAREYLYWGIGELQRINVQLANYGVMEQGMAQISTELIVAIYKIGGLKEILQAKDGAEQIGKRMSVIDTSKSMINAVLLDADAGEEFSRNTVNLAGVGDLWDKFMMTLSGVTKIPASKLFGRQASGLNNKGEQDERNYNKMIAGTQRTIVQEPLEQLLQVLTGKQVSFTFNPLWAPTQQEQISMRKEQAETDNIYLTQKVISPDEVRESRFKGKYSHETELTDGVMVGEAEEE